MMSVIRFPFLGSVVVALVLTFAPRVGAADASGLVVLAVSPAEGRAVIQEGGGAAEVRGPGDEIAEGRYTVRKVGLDHVVLEERADGQGAVEVWVYVAGEDGKSVVKRVQTAVGELPDVRVEQTPGIDRE